MTKKDFIAIAQVLAADYATATPAEKGKLWCLTLSMADMCARMATGYDFDRSKFYKAVLGTEDHFQARDRIGNEIIAAARNEAVALGSHLDAAHMASRKV